MLISAREELTDFLIFHNKTFHNITCIAVKYLKDLIDLKKLTKIEHFHFQYDTESIFHEFYGYILLDDGSWLERNTKLANKGWTYHRTPTEEELMKWMDGK